MTAFRLRTNAMMPPEVEQAAEQFISENPSKSVSTYLLRRYILQAMTPDYAKAFSLCSIMHQAQPHNIAMARLYNQLGSLRNNKADGNLPSFTAITTKGDTIGNAQLNSTANIIFVWASWMYDSYFVFHRLNTYIKEHPRTVSVLSIAIDAGPSESQKVLDRDSIQWPLVCDSMLWQSPVIEQLGICALPTNIITARNGNIVARNLNDNDLMQKVENLVGR